MGQAENNISKQIVDYLELLINNGIVIRYWRSQVLRGFFRPNKKAKEYWIIQGTPGLSDHSVLLCDGKTLYCESKTKRGVHLETQKQFKEDCFVAGAPYVKVRSAKELSDFFKIYFHGTKWEEKLIVL